MTIQIYITSVGNALAQVVEIHPREMQEPDFCRVNNMSIDGLVTQVSKAPEGMIWIGLDCICLTTTHVLKDILAVFHK